LARAECDVAQGRRISRNERFGTRREVPIEKVDAMGLVISKVENYELAALYSTAGKWSEVVSI
jgi:hypothetical protein